MTRKRTQTTESTPDLRIALETAVEEQENIDAGLVATQQAKQALKTAAPARESVFDPSKTYVMHEIKIDKFNTLRERRELTPCTCDECGFDVALDNDELPYDKHDNETQVVLREALAKHKRKFHDTAQKKLIKGSEVPEAWLGEKPRGGTGRRKR